MGSGCFFPPTRLAEPLVTLALQTRCARGSPSLPSRAPASLSTSAPAPRAPETSWRGQQAEKGSPRSGHCPACCRHLAAVVQRSSPVLYPPGPQQEGPGVWQCDKAFKASDDLLGPRCALRVHPRPAQGRSDAQRPRCIGTQQDNWRTLSGSSSWLLGSAWFLRPAERYLPPVPPFPHL